MSLVADHASALSEAIDASLERARSIYAQLALKSGTDDVSSILRERLTKLVHEARKDAASLGLAHGKAEFEDLTGERVTVSDPFVPDQAEVADYIENAIAEATAASDGEAFRASASHAEVILEAETVGAYERGKHAVYVAISELPADADRPWAVARSMQERAPVVLLVKRWSAYNDRRTCARCKSADGENALLLTLGSFSQPGPPAHPRCRCISHLWAVEGDYESKGIPAMGDETRSFSGERLESIARAYTPKEERAPSVDPKTRTVRVIASTDAVDSYGTRIDTKGWDLKRYEANPIVLACHDSRSIDAVLGTAELKINGRKLEATITFLPVGMSEQADKAFAMFEARVLKGVSVGFIPLEYHDETDKKGRAIRVFDRQELVELSVAPVPANPEALARALKEWQPTADTMPEEKGRTMSEPIAVLPAELAAKLAADSVDGALARIAEYELRADVLSRENAQLQERCARAEQCLAERVQKEREGEVDALIEAKRIPAEKRDSAIRLLGADPDAFRALYPAMARQVAPMSHLLDRVISPPPKPEATTARHEPQGSNPIGDLAKKIEIEWKAEGRSFDQQAVFLEADKRYRVALKANATAI